MKIEKLSDSQIKFTLDQNDLRERNVQIIELIHSPEKAREIILEMMDQALVEYDFHADNSPLMIEAMPASADTIVIVITKISQDEHRDHVESRFGRLNSLFDLAQDRHNMIDSSPDTSNEELLFKFDTLDSISLASNRLCNFYDGDSVLYKKDGKYYLWLHNFSDENSNLPINDLSYILAEYGNMEQPMKLSSTYLLEHGELVIKKSAIHVMASI